MKFFIFPVGWKTDHCIQYTPMTPQLDTDTYKLKIMKRFQRQAFCD